MGSISYNNFVSTPKFRVFDTDDEDDQALITQLLDEAEQDINEDYYLGKTVRAIMLLAAHRLELSPLRQAKIQGGATESMGAKLLAAGGLSSISVSHGSNSASFAPYDGKSKEGYYSQTLWGQELLEIMRTLPVLGAVW